MGIEEKKDVFENIKIINTLYKESAHISALNETKSIIKGVSKKINDKARLLASAKKEEKAKQEVVETTEVVVEAPIVEEVKEVKTETKPEVNVEEVKEVKKTSKKKVEPAEAVWIYHTGDDLDVISFNLTGKKYMIYRILQYSGLNMNQLKDGDILKWGV